MSKKLDAMEVYNAVNGGKGKWLGEVGIQSRPVYEIDGQVYEKAIHFDDGEDHNHYYQVSPERAEQLRNILAK